MNFSSSPAPATCILYDDIDSTEVSIPILTKFGRDIVELLICLLTAELAGHGARSASFRFGFMYCSLQKYPWLILIPILESESLGAAIRLECPDVNVMGGCWVFPHWCCSPETESPRDFLPRLLAVGLMNLGTFLAGETVLESVSGFSHDATSDNGVRLVVIHCCCCCCCC